MNWLTWAILSALFAGATAILAKIGVSGIDSNLATAVRTLVVLFFTFALAWSTGAIGGIGHLTPKNWLFLLLSGIATGLSWLCYFRALQLGAASQVAPIDKLSVVIAVLLAVAILGERPTTSQWLGIGMITMGAVVMVFKW